MKISINKEFKVIEYKDIDTPTFRKAFNNSPMVIVNDEEKQVISVYVSPNHSSKSFCCILEKDLESLTISQIVKYDFWLIYKKKVTIENLIGWMSKEDLLMQNCIFNKRRLSFIESVINSLPSGLIVVDNIGKITLINNKGELLLNDNEVTGKSLFDFFPSLDFNQLLQSAQYDTGIKAKSKNNDNIIFNLSPLKYDDELYGVVALFQKENEYEKLLEELDAYKNLALDLKAIFDSSYDVIYVSDSNGITLRVSSACKKLWGKDQSELVGRSVYDLEKEGIYRPSVTRLVLEKKEKVSIIQNTKTGRRLMVVGTPIKDENGKIIRVVNASRDITEVSQLQSELNEMRQLIEGYKKELNDLRSRNEAENQIVYKSEEMNKVISLAKKVAEVDSTVLILGETGVGKEVISSFIHRSSPRNDKPFIKINCGAIPENLLESELFGYEKGAFTGANRQKMGLFELANEGTLFLDEIGEIPVHLQTKLLRVIQEQELMRIGGTKPIKINVRIIAATNKDLMQEVEKGNFREDLYYRLNVIPIRIPPLRERKEDIFPLSLHFINYYNQKYMKSKKLSSSALEILQQYEWPGNVRELQNIIERLVILTDGNIIEESDIQGIFPTKKQNASKVFVSGIMPLKKCIIEAENQLLKLAKEKYKTTSEMAKALGVDQSTISRKLQRIKNLYW